jgi:hypothetical protein
MPPLALTDAQLDVIHRLSWPLAPRDRSAFLVVSRIFRTFGFG